jgi:hypothetical protein
MMMMMMMMMMMVKMMEMMMMLSSPFDEIRERKGVQQGKSTLNFDR